MHQKDNHPLPLHSVRVKVSKGERRDTVHPCPPSSRAPVRTPWLGWYSAAETSGPSEATRAPALTDLRETEGQAHSPVIPESRQESNTPLLYQRVYQRVTLEIYKQITLEGHPLFQTLTVIIKTQGVSPLLEKLIPKWYPEHRGNVLPPPTEQTWVSAFKRCNCKSFQKNTQQLIVIIIPSLHSQNNGQMSPCNRIVQKW